MKKTELVYREMLYQAIENKNNKLTQSEISKKLEISLSIVNLCVKKLANIGAIKINQRSFNILDLRKILYYWASVRNLEKDIVFKLRIELPVREIERIMPNIIFTAYTTYKLKFNDIPADYSEIYVYADENEIKEIKKRLLKIKVSEKNPNFFILKKDNLMDRYKKIPISQIFCDLWNLKEWYAKEFLNSLEKKLNLDPEKSGFNPPCFISEIKNSDFSACKELKTLGVLTQSSLHK